METITCILHYFSTHLVVTIAFGIAVSAIFAVLAKYKKKRIYTIAWVTCSLVFGLFFPLLGTYITKPLINTFGKDGTGVVTSIENTNNRFNEQRVVEFLILLKKEDGTLAEARFQSWTNLLYPNDASYGFPQVGQEFKMKYLSKYPQSFIILTNADSPYAKAGKCAELGRKLNDARITYEFDTTNVLNGKKYADIMEKYVFENKCFPNDALEDHYRNEIRRLRRH